jgi:hypothetical protein
MMDLHIRSGLLSGCLILVGCLLGILPLGVGDLLISWVMSFMMATWRWLLAWRRTYLGGATFYILEEGIGS